MTDKNNESSHIMKEKTAAELTRKKRDEKVSRRLRQIYSDKLRPIEDSFLFNKLGNRPLLDGDFFSKPTLFLCGQFSVGKTTFIKHLIGEAYPGSSITAAPSTDKFFGVVHGLEHRNIEGHAAASSKDLPFNGLSHFGDAFLSKFTVSTVPSDALINLNIIDTPGILSGLGGSSRGYDLLAVTGWFAQHSDLIMLMFDSANLDISKEYQKVIENLQPYEEKVVCILNKADDLRMEKDHLMKVYGALLWSMARVFRRPEPQYVHICSFKEDPKTPYTRQEHTAILDKDGASIIKKLDDLPKNCLMRKLNVLLKRISLLRATMCIIQQLHIKMPYLWGHEKRQDYLIEHLEEVYNEMQIKNLGIYPPIPAGDYPPIAEMQIYLSKLNFKTDFKAFDGGHYRESHAVLRQILEEEKNHFSEIISGLFSKDKSEDDDDDDDGDDDDDDDDVEDDNINGGASSGKRNGVSRLLRDAVFAGEEKKSINKILLLVCFLALVLGIAFAHYKNFDVIPFSLLFQRQGIVQ